MKFFGKAVKISILGVLFSIGLSTNALADGVDEVIVDSVNIRSGPGTNYAILDTAVLDEDLIEYCGEFGNCESKATADYRWEKVLYPNATYGKYTINSMGWVAANDYTSGRSVNNTTWTKNVYAPTTTTLYGSFKPFGNAKRTVSAGTVLGSWETYLQAEAQDRNAWRVNDNGQLRWVDGWKVKAR